MVSPDPYASGSHACGALGAYDPLRVAAIARLLGAEPVPAHSDATSILHTRREPTRWSKGLRSGLAWSERPGTVTSDSFREWRDAATDGAACGLGLHGRRRFLHTSVSGASALYWLADSKAIYFATRIDPLAATNPGGLTPDWDAWATILTIGCPFAGRTPFAEIRRLGVFETLRLRRGTPLVERHRWPWAEVEPSLEIEQGVDAVIDRMRAAVGTLPSGPLTTLLSGGWDSRLLLGLVAEHRREDARSLTVSMDAGDDREEKLAAAAAAHLDLPNELVHGSPERFWQETCDRALETDYQHVSLPVFMPLAHALRGRPGIALDGLALDVLTQPGGRFITQEAVTHGGTPRASIALWDRMMETHGTAAAEGMKPRLAAAVKASARAQMLTEGSRFDGHPASAILTFYVTRTMRGVALATLSRSEIPLATPFTDDKVARAAWAISPRAKLEASMYTPLFARLDPALGNLPSTSAPASPAAGAKASLPRRKFAPEPVAEYRRMLMAGPLTPYFSTRMRRAASGEAGRGWGGMHRATLCAVLFHLWHDRYRDRLGEVNPAEGLGLRKAR